MPVTILEEGTPRRPPTSPTVADSGAWERAELQPIIRNLGRIVRRDQGPTSLGVATPVTAWQQEVAEGASACAAATACTWRVGEGGAPAAYAQSRTDCTAGSGPNIFGRGYACHSVMSAEETMARHAARTSGTEPARSLQRRSIHKDNIHGRRSPSLSAGRSGGRSHRYAHRE